MTKREIVIALEKLSKKYHGINLVGNNTIDPKEVCQDIDDLLTKVDYHKETDKAWIWFIYFQDERQDQQEQELNRIADECDVSLTPTGESRIGYSGELEKLYLIEGYETSIEEFHMLLEDDESNIM